MNAGNENDIMDPGDANAQTPDPSGFSQQKLVSFVTEIHTLSIDISLRDCSQAVIKSPTQYHCEFSRTFKRYSLVFTMTNGNPSSVIIKQHCGRSNVVTATSNPISNAHLQRHNYLESSRFKDKDFRKLNLKLSKIMKKYEHVCTKRHKDSQNGERRQRQ
ncbi:hypothetical protein Tco_0196558 [Tanacetum coccineum]